MSRSDYESLRKKLGSHEKKKREIWEREMSYRVEFMGVLGVTVVWTLFLGEVDNYALSFFFSFFSSLFGNLPRIFFFFPSK